MADSDAAHTAILEKLIRDRVLAHQVLFAHRHPSLTPPFHDEMIRDWHGSHARLVRKAFRGGAKSTLAEEAITIMALLREFRNCVILGESETRAVERLRAIKHEFEFNPYIEDLFGSLVGPVWTETKVILTNGIVLQAHGRGQSLRGVKHLDARPDLWFVDDLEDNESVATPEAREKWLRWFFSVVMPAADPTARFRVVGTPLDPEALLEKLSADQDWDSKTYPIEYRDLEGSLRATWEDRFPLPEIDKIRASFERQGLANQFAQEYLCQSVDPATKPFTSEMFRVEPTLRSWHAVYAMVDPARTAKPDSSATTGVAVWSWINNRLIVWDSYAKFWKPDEIVSDLFAIGETYNPVTIGVEEDGLNEFILQPVRQAQLGRGVSLPIRAVRAPKGKLDFIRGLQPFFNAREVVFAKDLPDLRSQLLSFPTGRIDAPNALAYALSLRPGSVIYDGFSVQNISEDLTVAPSVTCHLAVNASQFSTTAVLVQLVEGALHVLADWVREGDPGLVLSDVVKEAGLEAGKACRVLAPSSHFGNYDRIGLRAAAARVPVEMRRGGSELEGREEIRSLLTRSQRGFPKLRVSTRARWTLNAFSGGYARLLTKAGVLTEFATEGPYRTLMEGLESFAALMKVKAREDDNSVNWKLDSSGRRYMSARA